MIQTLSALGSGHSMDPFLQAPLCRALRIAPPPPQACVVLGALVSGTW